MQRRHESPVRRVTKGRKVRWLARYTAPDGRRLSAGTYRRQSEAQDAIDRAYDRPRAADTIGAYAATWPERRPRSARTNATNAHRLSRVLDVRLEGIPLEHWPMRDLHRRHAVELVAHLLNVQGRAAVGATGIVRVLSALFEDAHDDGLAPAANPFRGVTVESNDPRIQKPARAPMVFDFDQMHALAAASPVPAMVRVMSDCGLRLGEALGLARRDFDGEALHLRGSAHEGRFLEGDTRTKRHVRSVPVPASTAALIRALPIRLDTPLLFPTLTGKLWRERNFYRDVWYPTTLRMLCDAATWELASARPHDFRHSWESHLHAAAIDPADLAEIAGHTVATMHGRYVHALNRSADDVRAVVG